MYSYCFIRNVTQKVETFSGDIEKEKWREWERKFFFSLIPIFFMAYP